MAAPDMPQEEEHQAQSERAAREMPQQQVQPKELQQELELAPEAPGRPLQPEQEPELAPEVQQEAPPEAWADQEAEQDEASPKAGRRRRRRRHRRGAAAAAGDLSDDDSGPSQDGASPHHGASPPANPNRNVVTWSDLGGDDCVLRRALPVGRVVHTAPRPANLMVTAAPPVVLYGPPVLYGPVHWPCTGVAAEAVHCPGVQQTGMEAKAKAEWTDNDSHELRQWLCGTLGGVGVPHMSDLADLLQDLSQQAYED